MGTQQKNVVSAPTAAERTPMPDHRAARATRAPGASPIRGALLEMMEQSAAAWRGGIVAAGGEARERVADVVELAPSAIEVGELGPRPLPDLCASRHLVVAQ